MRRLLIFALALSLPGLGPLPLSACAVFTSKVVECATPQTQSQCDEMNMDDGNAKVAAAPDGSCCSVSNAPAPATLQKASRISVPAASIVLLGTVSNIPGAIEQREVEIEQAPSPPPLQPFLCTFLI